MLRIAALLLVAALAGCASAVRPALPPPSPVPSSSSRPAPATPIIATTPAATVSRSPAATVTIPPVSAAAQAAGLIDVRTAVPDAVLDLRYATSHNFTGVDLYPPDARCLVNRAMAPGLSAAAAALRPRGYRLVFWDCYRPHDVQVRMYRVVSNPDWVARPGPYSRSHETGLSVDVTLTSTVGLLDMGTGFDDFTPRAHAYATTGLTPAEQANRALLRDAMAAGGLAGYSGEWWHFDGPGASERRPIVDVPVG